MTDDHCAHLQNPGVLAAQEALDEHLVEHEPCRAVAHQRDLCPEGGRLHDAVVAAAQAAYRGVHPEAFAPEPHDG